MNEEIKRKQELIRLTVKLNGLIKSLGGLSILLLPLSIVAGILFDLYILRISLCLFLIIISSISLSFILDRVEIEIDNEINGLNND